LDPLQNQSFEILLILKTHVLVLETVFGKQDLREDEVFIRIVTWIVSYSAKK
jgi:hypothetical protein